jgi:prolyl 4-hydroxylase
MKPAVPLELLQWVEEQAKAGFSPEQLHQSMLSHGWTQEIAQRAIAAVSRDLFIKPAEISAVSETDQKILLDNRNVNRTQPGADLAGSSTLINAGDRNISVLLSLRPPNVALFGNLLSAQECADIITLAKPRMARSTTVNTQEGGALTNEVRTSQGCFLRRGENDLLNRVETRIAKLLNWPVSHGEDLQILHYMPGAEYKPHYDYFDPALPGCVPLLERGGQRVGTLVMYLNTPQEGGGTTFPDVGLEVFPQQGYGVYFGYDRPHPDTKSLHGGSPVITGEKWIAVKWLREKVFT